MTMICFPLLLQKPSKNSKTKEHIRYLEKRIELWKQGRFDLLISEGKAIQQHLLKSKQTEQNREKVFVRLMLHGKVSAALRWIGSNKSNLLECSPEVVEVLKSKHPPAEPQFAEACIDGEKIRVEDVIFENIDSELIYQCAKRVNG